MLQGQFKPFFQVPCFSVHKTIRTDAIREPKIDIRADEGLLIALVVAEAGFFAGDIEQVFNARGDYVVAAYWFIQFRNDYKSEFYYLNNEKDNK